MVSRSFWLASTSIILLRWLNASKWITSSPRNFWGTQSISPLFWSIESGSLNSARAMIVDLLTIRADRDVYYYGCAPRCKEIWPNIGRVAPDGFFGFFFIFTSFWTYMSIGVAWSWEGCSKDAMFTRHPDLILRLCNDASTLLWTLFDGLVWRHGVERHRKARTQTHGYIILCRYMCLTQLEFILISCECREGSGQSMLVFPSRDAGPDDT